MTKQKGAHRNIAMMTAGVLLCLTLVSVWMVSGLFAKFTTSDSAKDSARVAAFVFTVSDKDTSRIIDLQDVTKPGDTETYTFIVKNSGGTVSEVKETAYVQLSLNGSLPLTCKVTKSGGTAPETSLTANGSPQVGDLTDLTTFSARVSTNETYELTVEWPASANSIEYASAGAVSRLIMSVYGVQVD